MSKEKLARRKKMGDDPTAVSKSNSSEAGMVPPQPMPGMPQGKGNMTNNTLVGKSMGDGLPQSGALSGVNYYPYLDGGIPSVGGQMGTVGFAPPSGNNQNMVGGTILNRGVAQVQQPYEDSMRMMGPMHDAQQAANFSMKHYGEKGTPPYQVGPLGMMGTPAELNSQTPNPAQFPGNMPQQSGNFLSLNGSPDISATMAKGMSTKSGGRNKSKGDA